MKASRIRIVKRAVGSSSEQGTREAGGTTAAVDADFAAGEGADIEAGAPKAVVGPAIFFDRQESPGAEREDVAGQRVALAVFDFDELVTTRMEQFHGFHGEPREIDQHGLFVEQTDKGH